MHELGVETPDHHQRGGRHQRTFDVGDFCIMTDHINFTGRNPVVGTEPDKLAFRFFSMLDAYDPHLRALAREAACELDVPVREGVYLGLLGPSFETPAEIRAFRAWGADTVAMSVVEEVIAARHVGMRVLGMSLVSNMACGVGGADPDDVEVFDVASKRGEDFRRLVRRDRRALVGAGMLALHVLGSGSKGNAAIVEDVASGRGVAIDCGFASATSWGARGGGVRSFAPRRRFADA